MSSPSRLRWQHIAGDQRALHRGQGGNSEPRLAGCGTAGAATVDTIRLRGVADATGVRNGRVAATITPLPIAEPFSFPYATAPPRRNRRHITWGTRG